MNWALRRIQKFLHVRGFHSLNLPVHGGLGPPYPRPVALPPGLGCFWIESPKSTSYLVVSLVSVSETNVEYKIDYISKIVKFSEKSISEHCASFRTKKIHIISEKLKIGKLICHSFQNISQLFEEKKDWLFLKGGRLFLHVVN